MDKYPPSDNHSYLETYGDKELSEHIEMSKARVADFLSRHSVDIDYIKTTEVSSRSDYLISMFPEEDAEMCTSRAEIGTSVDDDVGVLLIKPEILPGEDQVVRFLEDQGFETKPLGRIYPTHEEWMDTYGYMLNRHPDVINLYIMQRSLGFRPVLFRHLDTNRYSFLVGSRGETTSKSSDKDRLFDQLFCGEANDEHPGTLRGEVSFPIMRRLGFDDMSGYASLFDPVDYFKDIGMIKNYSAYNGVHIPSDATEKRRNINTLLFRSGNDERND